MDFDANFTPDRTYSYEILPEISKVRFSEPKGGAFKADAKFKSQLQSYLKQSAVKDRWEIAFRSATIPAKRVPAKRVPAKRENAVRSLILDFCFGTGLVAKKASIALATRLGRAMDERSPATQLFLVSYKSKIDSDLRRIAMWTVTLDTPFQFSSWGFTRSRIISNAFTPIDAVLYEGRLDESSFTHGYVNERQTRVPTANHWVSDFLDSDYVIEREQDKYSRVYISAAPHDINAVLIYNELQSQDFRPYFPSRKAGLGKAWV